jgi:hypothetical protein
MKSCVKGIKKQPISIVSDAGDATYIHTPPSLTMRY